MAQTLKKKSKGKDLPRYKVTEGYERDFKRQYGKHLGIAISKIVKFLNGTNS